MMRSRYSAFSFSSSVSHSISVLDDDDKMIFSSIVVAPEEADIVEDVSSPRSYLVVFHTTSSSLYMVVVKLSVMLSSLIVSVEEDLFSNSEGAVMTIDIVDSFSVITATEADIVEAVDNTVG